MKVNGEHFRTIWLKKDDPTIIQIIDQRWLPHKFIIENIKSLDDAVKSIKDMHVRGAGLIGAMAGFGFYLACLEAKQLNPNSFGQFITNAIKKINATRPTAVNLAWALERQLSAINSKKNNFEKIKIALETAKEIANEDAKYCENIGENGLDIIKNISNRKKGKTVNILTHCNAGWLAFVDYGSATAPIYAAFNNNIKIHVWVDETRPRNQGARLTAWELGQHKVPHTVIADNVGGHLMQNGMVDLVIVGSDRTTYTGDVANKIGTYLKALAAKDNNVPFYVALPSSTFDWKISDGMKIPIEERNGDEVKYIQGLHEGKISKILLTPLNSATKNYGFDITPSRLITGLITERGICEANKESIFNLFPEKISLKK